MVQAITGSAPVSGEREVPYTLIRPDGGQGRAVCFVCPGASYLFDKPLLHFSTMTLVRFGADVVHVRYAYGKDNTVFWNLPEDERSRVMQEDVRAVTERVLHHSDYEQVLFLGKSIGTLPIVNGVCRSPRHAQAAVILLTPLLTLQTVADHLLTCPQAVFLAIGTGDPYYSEQVIRLLAKTRPNVTLHIVPQANHALEIGLDAEASLDVLRSLMRDMALFLSDRLPIPAR